MEAIYVKNGRFEVEVLDGRITKLINSNSPSCGNLADREPLSMSKIAFVVGVNEPAQTIEFNSPGDASIPRSKIANAIQAEIDRLSK